MTALTTVILEGSMGKKFGRKWELAVSSPDEALRMINANKPGVFVWIRDNLEKYTHYRVIVDDDERSDETYELQCKAKTIRFVPLVEGASAGFRFAVGAVLIIAGALLSWTPFGAPMIAMGVGLVAGAVTEWLTPKPKMSNDIYERKDKTSHYFDGPVNTERQGIPVPLIYGRCLVGAQCISAIMTVNEVSV